MTNPRIWTPRPNSTLRKALRLADRAVVMWPRPGKVLRDVAVDLPRPRGHDDPEYLRLRRVILRLLGETERSTA
ncbi:hypothetical protein [Nocardia sp. CA-120079]|uniref:hypothetical protein n=1 Tax=Nocardia sp. CA-120079 TaxID=3239974 RepID=UPI003D984A63